METIRIPDTGKLAFLHPDWCCGIPLDGTVYQSVSAACEACKCREPRDMPFFRLATAEEARRLWKTPGGQKIPKITEQEWEAKAQETISLLTELKFENAFPLRAKLLATGDALIDDGTPGNLHGEALMQVRGKLRKNTLT